MAQRGRKLQDSALKQELVSRNFPKVISMVESGENIYEALNKLGINRTLFYRLITTQQKLELQMAKTLNTKYGAGCNFKRYR